MLGDKYRLGPSIGSGSAGTVYVAENLAIRRRVAIKLLDAALAKTPEAVARFHREAQAAGRLGHAHLVEVLDLGTTDDNVPFIVMEYLEGTTLRDVLAAEGRLEVPRAVDIALQTLDVLQAAHAEGIIHRDLKPENLFLTRRGRRGDFVKVLDFGVAKFSEPGAGNLTDQGMTVGTPNYMSPEQVRGRELDPRSDVYSMAVVIWEMLAGVLPHEGENANEKMISIVTKDPPGLTEVRPDVDPRLCAIVARAMLRNPVERTASARELAAALEPFGAAMEIDVGDDVVSLPPRAVPGMALSDTPDAREEDSDTAPEGTPIVRGQRDIATEYIASRPATIEASASQRAAGRRTMMLVAVGLVAAAGFVAWALGTSGTADPGRGAVAPAVHLPPLPPPPPRAAASPTRPPTQAPATPARVRLEVDANVTGAFVTLDGDPLGTTPLATEVPVSPGEHVLEVSADDHAPTVERMRLDAPIALRVELTPLEAGERRTPRRPGGGRRPVKGHKAPPKERTFDPFAPR